MIVGTVVSKESFLKIFEEAGNITDIEPCLNLVEIILAVLRTSSKASS